MTVNKGADQTVQMSRLVCAFVVCMQQSQGFPEKAILLVHFLYPVEYGMIQIVGVHKFCQYLHFQSKPLINL